MGLNGCGKEGIRWEIAECSAEARENPEFDAPHLEVTLRMREPVQDLEMTRCFALYPGLPVIAVWNTIRSAVTPRVFWNPRSQESDWNREEERKESRVDSLRLAPGFSAVESVEFRGRTDEHDDLVFRHPVSGKYADGNLLFAASADGRCVFYLQEAPPTQERRDMELLISVLTARRSTLSAGGSTRRSSVRERPSARTGMCSGSAGWRSGRRFCGTICDSAFRWMAHSTPSP